MLCIPEQLGDLARRSPHVDQIEAGSEVGCLCYLSRIEVFEAVPFPGIQSDQRAALREFNQLKAHHTGSGQDLSFNIAAWNRARIGKQICDPLVEEAFGRQDPFGMSTLVSLRLVDVEKSVSFSLTGPELGLAMLRKVAARSDTSPSAWLLIRVK